MKNRFIAIVALLAMVGCSNFEEPEMTPVVGGENEVVTATIDAEETRTFLGEEGAIMWCADDQISIFKKTARHQKYLLTGGANTTKASFSYDTQAKFSVAHEGNTDYNYGVYPFSENHTLSAEGVVTADLSNLAVQNYTEGSFEEGKALMTAKSDDLHFNFRNNLSMLNLRVGTTIPAEYSVLEVSISMNNGALLNGIATIDVLGNEKPAALFTEGTSTTVLKLAEPVLLENDIDANMVGGHDFYILVPAMEVEAQQLKISMKLSNNATGEEFTWETDYKNATSFIRSQYTTIAKLFEGDECTGEIEGAAIGDIVTIGEGENAHKAIIFSVSDDEVLAVSVEENMGVQENGTRLNWDDAKAWCESFGTGWRMATLEEMQAIHAARFGLNDSLEADDANNQLFWEGDDRIPETNKYAVYWTSTECDPVTYFEEVYLIYFDAEGRVLGYTKGIPYGNRVRAVYDLKATYASDATSVIEGLNNKDLSTVVVSESLTHDGAIEMADGNNADITLNAQGNTITTGNNTNYGFIVNSGNKLTIEEAEVVSMGGGLGVTGGGEVVFNSGSLAVNTTTTNPRYNIYAVGEGTVVTVNGGEFSFSNKTNKRAYVYCGSGAKVYINGGTFGAAAQRSGYEAGILTGEGGEVIITGGTFGFNPTTWVAEGYQVAYDSSTKTWTVSK